MTGRSRWIAVTRSSDEKPVRLAILKQNRYTVIPAQDYNLVRTQKKYIPPHSNYNLEQGIHQSNGYSTSSTLAALPVLWMIFYDYVCKETHLFCL
jgi:hypothetical protein